MSNAVLTSEPRPRLDASLQPLLDHREPPVNPEVLSELERILESPAFRTSSRCRAFLRHVVTYAHSPEALKERTLGVTLFGRVPDYDTGADAIVRVKASEVRRKLAEYSVQADPERNVKIELQPGSYAPRITIHTLEKPPSPVNEASQELPSPPQIINEIPLWRRHLVVAALVVLCLACWLGFSITTSHSADRRFLQPFLATEKPIICISHPNGYNLSPNKAIGRGDAPEALRLKNILLSLGRSSRIGLAQDITAEDLSSSPMIVVGGPRFNRWTMNLTENLRFAFDVVDDKPRIYDRLNPLRYWIDSETDDQIGPGYVIITRLLPTRRQKSVLCIAGLRALDTRAGTEVISDSKVLNDLLKNAPDDWAQKNLQWILLVKDRGPVELRAATYW